MGLPDSLLGMIRIRQLDPRVQEDQELIGRALESSWAETVPDGFPGYERRHLKTYAREFHSWWAGYLNGDVAGVWALEGVLGYWDAYRVHTMILPEYQGRGMRLTQAAIGHAWALGYSQLFTEVTSNNRRALRLVRALGFEEQGAQPDTFVKDGEVYDTLSFSLTKEAYARSNPSWRSGGGSSSDHP